MDLLTVRALQASAFLHSCLHSRLHFWTATLNIPPSEPVLDSPVKLMGWIQAQRTDFLEEHWLWLPCCLTRWLSLCAALIIQSPCTRERTWFSWVPASFSHSPPWPGDFSLILGLEHSGGWCYTCCLFSSSLGSPELRDPAQFSSCLIAAVTTLLQKNVFFLFNCCVTQPSPYVDICLTPKSP